MKKLAKKLIIFSMVGLMQVGMFASAAEAAAPRPDDPSGFEQRDEHHHRDMERERRIREENERHEKEMKRRPHESKQHWHERQKHEMERHERAIHEIMEMGHR